MNLFKNSKARNEKASNVLFALVVVTALAGCAHPRPITQSYNIIRGQHSHQQIKNAILLAGQTHWIMSASSDGVIDARRQTDDHIVSVRIYYNLHDYRINYVSSENMSASDGNIDRKYHHWLVDLNKSIQINLQRHQGIANSITAPGN